MKYFLLIAALATMISFTQASGASTSADCCGGGGCCRPAKACCKIAH